MNEKSRPYPGGDLALTKLSTSFLADKFWVILVISCSGFGLPLFGESHGLVTGSSSSFFIQKISDYQYHTEDFRSATWNLRTLVHLGDFK